MVNINKPIAILGGTFDPVHFGHLRLALEVQQQLAIQEIRFIPCQKPVLDKTASATSAQRLAMLQLAIANQPGFKIDERELQRPTPSYMVDTLLSLRQDITDQPLCLILGSDAFENLPRWHRWQELLNLTHLIIVTRPEHIFTLSEPLASLLQQHKIANPALLASQPQGFIYQLAITPLAISSTYIRQQITNQMSPRYLLPESVLDYIKQKKLYIKP